VARFERLPWVGYIAAQWESIENPPEGAVKLAREHLDRARGELEADHEGQVQGLFDDS